MCKRKAVFIVRWCVGLCYVPLLVYFGLLLSQYDDLILCVVIFLICEALVCADAVEGSNLSAD